MKANDKKKIILIYCIYKIGLLYKSACHTGRTRVNNERCIIIIIIDIIIGFQVVLQLYYRVHFIILFHFTNMFFKQENSCNTTLSIENGT